MAETATAPSAFTMDIIKAIRSVPKGRVATYQQIAGLAGRPHASRAVAWVLKSCSRKYELPWQRIISSQGRIAFKSGTRNFLLQRRMLRDEGVEVVGVKGEINLPKFQYRKKAKTKRKRLEPRMFT